MRGRTFHIHTNNCTKMYANFPDTETNETVSYKVANLVYGTITHGDLPKMLNYYLLNMYLMMGFQPTYKWAAFNMDLQRLLKRNQIK